MNKDDCMAQHVRELEANHPEWEHDQIIAVALKKCRESDKAMKEQTIKKGLLLSEQEVNYVTLSPKSNKACANCRFFCALGSDEGDGDLDNDCLIVEDDAPGAQPILPTGYCDRWEALPTPAEPEPPAPIPVTIVPSDDDMSMSMEAKASAPSSPDDYAYVPDEKKSSTWKLQIQDATHIADAITAMTTGFRGNDAKIPASAHAGVWRRISGAINKLPDGDTKDNLKKRVSEARKEYVEPEKAVNEDGLFMRLWERLQSTLAAPEKEQQAFTVFKGADGKDHWIAWYTNNFKDKDEEILSEKALIEDVTRKDMGLVPMPELWDWHVTGTKSGQADDLFRIGHFNIAIGHYEDTELGRKSAAYDRKHQKDIELSHGFTAPKWAFKDGIYEVANTFEISKLPKGKAANQFTYFDEVKEMGLSDAKRSHLEERYGKDFVAQLEAQAEQRGKALEELGVEFKDFATVTPAAVKEQDSTMAEMYLETTKAQGELATLMVAYKKAVDSQLETLKAALQNAEQSKQKAIEGYAAEVSELRKMVNAGPRPASQDAATTVSKVEVDKLKAKAPNADSKAEAYQAFLGLPITGGQ